MVHIFSFRGGFKLMLLLTLLKNLGPKLLGFAVLALVVFLSITWVNHKIVENTIQEQKIESLEKELDIRRKVDDILQESRESNPDRDGSIALERLRKDYPSD